MVGFWEEEALKLGRVSVGAEEQTTHCLPDAPSPQATYQGALWVTVRSWGRGEQRTPAVSLCGRGRLLQGKGAVMGALE